VTFALGLAALELHGKAATATAEHRMEHSGLQQVGNSEEACATRIGKPKGSILHRCRRQLLTWYSASKKNQERPE
jgi:hypothetical protein